MSDTDIHTLDLTPPLMKMGTLLSNYGIQNWSIYSNKQQNTCLTIRFNDMDGCTQPVYYRRISDNQLARNTARSIKHKQNKATLDNTKNDKKRKLSNANFDSPELARVQSCDQSDEYIDSPISPIKEYPYRNSVNGYQVDTEHDSAEICKGISSTPSVSKELCSPSISISPVMSDVTLLCSAPTKDPVIPLKQDAMCQIKCDTQSISTQVELLQKNRIIQCGTKTKPKSTQTTLINFSDETTQATPDPIICIDSAIQYESSLADKCVETVPIKPGQREPICVSAPRYGDSAKKCETFCYVAGSKNFDEKGHTDQYYHRCVNCRTFICDICIDYVSDYHWASCCEQPESDGVLYSSDLTPRS